MNINLQAIKKKKKDCVMKIYVLVILSVYFLSWSSLGGEENEMDMCLLRIL